MSKPVLLVDDDPDVREALGQTLELAGYDPVVAGSFVAAKDHLTPRFAGAVVSDIRMPGRDGFHLLDYVREVDAALPVILLTGEADIPLAVRGMSSGAFDFLEKPCAPQDLVAVVARAFAQRAQVLAARDKKAALEQGDAAARMLFGHSALAEALRQQARVAAQAGTAVLIAGAPRSATAKVAEVIHLLSAVARRPFVKRAAATLDADGMQNALAAARGGTLYLDEITRMADAMQAALAAALEQGAGLRVIAGTTRDMAQAVADGTCLAELADALDVIRVQIPPLRDRPEDIPVMFAQFVAQASEQANLRPPPITPALTAQLMAQDWPGNTRALMNAAMRFALGQQEPGPEVAQGQGQGLAAQMAQVERSLLVAALQRHRGRATDVARDLQLPRKTLYDKLAKHGLRPEEFRA